MFASGAAWRAAGFEVIRARDRKVMVALHPDCPQYVFKKYPSNTHSRHLELSRYTRRVEGARVLRAYILARQFRHLVVPEKWVLPLPTRFCTPGSTPHIVVADHVDIYDDDESARRYRRIEKDVLEELVSVWFDFRDLDFLVFNAPFTGERIAFVDTGQVAVTNLRMKYRKQDYLVAAQRVLTGSRLTYAKKLLKQLAGEVIG